MKQSFQKWLAAVSVCAMLALPASATETIKVLGQLAPAASSASITCTSASPMVCTWTGSNLALNDQVTFTSGTPPTGTSLNTPYFVISAGLTANAFELSTSQGGSAINSSSTGSGIVASSQRIVYTPSSTNTAVVSTISICNQSASPDTFRVAVQPAAAAIATKHYIAYGTTVPANNTIVLTLGVTLANTDIITVWTANGTSSFNVFGVEVAP